DSHRPSDPNTENPFSSECGFIAAHSDNLRGRGCRNLHSLFAPWGNDRPRSAPASIFRLAARDPSRLQHSLSNDQSLVHSEISFLVVSGRLFAIGPKLERLRYVWSSRLPSEKPPA